MGWVVVIPVGSDLRGFTGFKDGDRVYIPFMSEKDALEATSRYPEGHTENIPFGKLANLEEVS